ncbi:MAG: PfkB family carbohydrate kinase [Marinoscillum sp.]
MNKHILVVCPNPAVDIYASMDEFNMGEPNRITKEQRYPGGKGLHVGMALSELGYKVTIAGFWGGETGQWVKKSCNEYYPTIRFIGPELKEWTRSCYTFKSLGDFDDTEILGTGPNISVHEYQSFITSIKTLLAEAELMVLSGSWPKGSPEGGYAEIIQAGKEVNIKSIVDCTGTQLRHALLQKPFGVHLNRKEICEYYQCDFEEAKSKILTDCDLAAITDGSRGLHLLTPDSSYHSLAKIEKVLSTIGSGDCLTAGIAAGVIDTLDPQSIAAMGAACGAANCLREELGMLFKKDVELLLQQMNS